MKKLGFGLMRLPVLEDKPANINMEVLKEMVDVFLFLAVLVIFF